MADRRAVKDPVPLDPYYYGQQYDPAIESGGVVKEKPIKSADNLFHYDVPGFHGFAAKHRRKNNPPNLPDGLLAGEVFDANEWETNKNDENELQAYHSDTNASFNINELRFFTENVITPTQKAFGKYVWSVMDPEVVQELYNLQDKAPGKLDEKVAMRTMSKLYQMAFNTVVMIVLENFSKYSTLLRTAHLWKDMDVEDIEKKFLDRYKYDQTTPASEVDQITQDMRIAMEYILIKRIKRDLTKQTEATKDPSKLLKDINASYTFHTGNERKVEMNLKAEYGTRQAFPEQFSPKHHGSDIREILRFDKFDPKGDESGYFIQVLLSFALPLAYLVWFECALVKTVHYVDHYRNTVAGVDWRDGHYDEHNDLLMKLAHSTHPIDSYFLAFVRRMLIKYETPEELFDNGQKMAFEVYHLGVSHLLHSLSDIPEGEPDRELVYNRSFTTRPTFLWGFIMSKYAHTLWVWKHRDPETGKIRRGSRKKSPPESVTLSGEPSESTPDEPPGSPRESPPPRRRAPTPFAYGPGRSSVSSVDEGPLGGSTPRTSASPARLEIPDLPDTTATPSHNPSPTPTPSVPTRSTFARPRVYNRQANLAIRGKVKQFHAETPDKLSDSDIKYKGETKDVLGKPVYVYHSKKHNMYFVIKYCWQKVKLNSKYVKAIEKAKRSTRKPPEEMAMTLVNKKGKGKK
jgi:hypothetical protein